MATENGNIGINIAGQQTSATADDVERVLRTAYEVRASESVMLAALGVLKASAAASVSVSNCDISQPQQDFWEYPREEDEDVDREELKG